MPEQDDLSAQELQIAQSYAVGFTYQNIAETLGIAPSAVRTHLATIYCKLEDSSKLELLTRLGGHRAATAQPDRAEFGHLGTGT